MVVWRLRLLRWVSTLLGVPIQVQSMFFTKGKSE